MLSQSKRRRIFFYHGALVTEWNKDNSISLGMFIFIGKNHRNTNVLVHEYGHSIQSVILGPLYLLLIGLPSVLWARIPYFVRKRRINGTSYYDFIVEKSANRLGYRVTGILPPE